MLQVVYHTMVVTGVIDKLLYVKKILNSKGSSVLIISMCAMGLVLATVIGASVQSKDDTNHDNMDMSLHCQHFPADCEGDEGDTENSDDHSHSNEASETLLEPGQGMFGALSEINTQLEQGNTSWANVDMDRLWEHLRDMDALMTGVTVTKTNLPDGLQMLMSGEGSAKRAMDNMLPAHSSFLRSARPDWDIQIEQAENDYILTVTSSNPVEAQRIQALGFSGFMVQDDHHASHHLGLALGEVVH